MSATRDDAKRLRLARKHREYDQRLAAIQARRFPSDLERLEETRLKKLKLKIKDEMKALVRKPERPVGRNG